MIKAFIFACSVTGLSQCSSAQHYVNVAGAYGAYAAALSAAYRYSQESMADPGAVVKMAEINDAPAMIDAQLFGKAYVFCGGDKAAIVPDFDCSKSDFSRPEIHAEVLRTGALSLLEAKNKGQRDMKISMGHDH